MSAAAGKPSGVGWRVRPTPSMGTSRVRARDIALATDVAGGERAEEKPRPDAELRQRPLDSVGLYLERSRAAGRPPPSPPTGGRSQRHD
jgi:hypothetical protein